MSLGEKFNALLEKEKMEEIPFDAIEVDKRYILRSGEHFYAGTITKKDNDSNREGDCDGHFTVSSVAEIHDFDPHRAKPLNPNDPIIKQNKSIEYYGDIHFYQPINSAKGKTKNKKQKTKRTTRRNKKTRRNKTRFY